MVEAMREGEGPRETPRIFELSDWVNGWRTSLEGEESRVSYLRWLLNIHVAVLRRQMEPGLGSS